MKKLSVFSQTALMLILLAGVSVADVRVAAKKGNLEVVRDWVKSNPSLINLRDEDEGLSLLHYASANGQLAVVKFLVSKGAKINYKSTSSTGGTPLQLASLSGHYDVVDFLLSKGANPNLPNNFGSIALHYTAEAPFFKEKASKCAELLIKYKSEVNRKNSSDMTPYGLAKAQKNVPVANVLRKYGGRE